MLTTLPLLAISLMRPQVVAEVNVIGCGSVE